MKAVILVGGEGTRLRPLTINTPKPMIPLVNIPLLEYTLHHLKQYGIREIILSTCYLPQVFESYFGDGSRFGLDITYVTEEKPLGTCGAVKNVEKYLDGTFIVLNGDVITSLNLEDMISFHRTRGAVGTIYLTPVEDPTAYGLVLVDEKGRVESFLEKPSWDQVTTSLINGGTYILELEVLDLVPAGQNYSFERGLFPALLERDQPLFGYPSLAYWMEIGAPEKYLKAHWDILDGKFEPGFLEIKGSCSPRLGEGTFVDPSARILGTVVIGDGCHIGADVTITGPAVLGSGCSVGKSTTLEGSVVLDDCTIGRACRIKESILSKGVSLQDEVHVLDNSVIGDHCLIEKDNQLKRAIRVFPSTHLKEGSIKF